MQDSIKALQEKIDAILARQQSLNNEVLQLKKELDVLARKEKPAEAAVTPVVQKPEPVAETITPPVEPVKPTPPPVTPAPAKPAYVPPAYVPPVKTKSDWERFVGENLISKIGILVTIIGVGIGVKYAIDNQLASPWMRIVFGYLCAGGLLGTAVRLKKKYNNFSAVLFSGGVASAYFTTYFASVFYEFIPREVAFPLMVLFTVGTVWAAIWYGREVIAHIGLWGAYAVPVLLGSGSQKTDWLYLYMCLINVGIVFISYKKNWKFIFANAFVSTWLVFLFASFVHAHEGHTAAMELLFATVFFAIFHTTGLAYMAKTKEKADAAALLIPIANALAYAGMGYFLFTRAFPNTGVDGLFLALNAAIHLPTAFVLYGKTGWHKTYAQTFTALGLLMLTVAVPIQFEGLWVPVLWAVFILCLHFLYKKTEQNFFGEISIPLYVLVMGGALYAWGMNVYWVDVPGNWRVFMRMDFLQSLILIGIVATVYFTGRKKNPLSTEDAQPAPTPTSTPKTAGLAGLLFVGVLYFTFLAEIIAAYRFGYLQSFMDVKLDVGDTATYEISNRILINKGVIAALSYTFVFCAAAAFANVYTAKNQIFAGLQQVAIALVMLLCLTVGLENLFHLDHKYLHPSYPEYFPPQASWINIRYLLFGSLVTLVSAQWTYIRRQFFPKGYALTLIIVFHVVCLILASHEIMHWSRIGHIEKLDKYGISIFWGVYTLFLISYGMWKKHKHLRILGMVVAGITLLKLFIYDTSNLATIPKTILFVAIGLLLLLISFLYNKYKGRL